MSSAFAHLLPLLPSSASSTSSSASSSSSSPSSSSSSSDANWDHALAAAIVEAERGIGRTKPNPPVGCVITDDDGTILARGFHTKAGEPHAEVEALLDFNARHGAGAARGKTAVVTLEPCAHHGRTPPCAQRLIDEGVARVVVGCRDPNPQVDGRGLKALTAAGIEVIEASGHLAQRCQALLQPFSASMQRRRPWVVLKTASSLDGRVATSTGASRFITGSESRRLVHGLRDAVDVVLVGAGTALADDPALTVRDWVRPDGSPCRDPARVLLDKRGEVPLTHKLFDPPGCLRVHEVLRRPKPIPGVENLPLADLGIAAVLDALGARGVLSVLIEAGPRLAAGALKAGVVDELWWFQAPMVIGADGQPAVGSLDVTALSDAMPLERFHDVAVGTDRLSIFGPLRASMVVG